MNLKQALVAVATTVMVGAVPTAQAGLHWTGDVWVNSSSRVARGILSEARNSADSTQMIYCEVRTYPSYSRGLCFARTAAVVDATCYTTDANLIAAIQTLKGDSSVEFGWDASGVCTTLLIRNGSMFAPKES